MRVVLNKAEINYSTIEKEALAIVWGVKHFRPYLFGRHFEILSDHKPLIWLMKTNDPGSRLLRWKIKLADYNFIISHVSGYQNIVADTLSRICHINAITRSQTKIKPLESKNEIQDIQESLPTVDIQHTKTIIIFTTVEDSSKSPFRPTKDFGIIGRKNDIIRHRRHNKTFYLIFYKGNKNKSFLLSEFTELLTNLSQKIKFRMLLFMMN